MKGAAIFSLRDQVTGQYRTYLRALDGLVDRTLDDADPTSAMARSRFRMMVAQQLSDSVRAVESSMRAYAAELAERAVTDAQSALGIAMDRTLAERLTGNAAEQSEDMLIRLSDQMKRDANETSHWMRSFAMEVEGTMRSRGFTRSASVIAIRQSKDRPRRLAFDSLGRRWPSDRFVRLLSSQLLFAAYNETYLYALTMLGRNRAVASREDEVIQFTILKSEKGFPHLPEIRGKVFHPGSGFVVRGK